MGFFSDLRDTVITVGTLGLVNPGATRAAEQSAAVQAQAAAENKDVLANYLQQTREDTARARFIGDQAIESLGGLYGFSPMPQTTAAQGNKGPATIPAATSPSPSTRPNFSNFLLSPDYEFARQEGEKALGRNAAAGGMLGAGATGKALVQYGQGLATQQYGNYFNRLAALAGIGQAATGTATGVGGGVAQGIAAQNTAAADARASGYINRANVLTGGISNILNLGGQLGAGYLAGR